MEVLGAELKQYEMNDGTKLEQVDFGLSVASLSCLGSRLYFGTIAASTSNVNKCPGPAFLSHHGAVKGVCSKEILPMHFDFR